MKPLRTLLQQRATQSNIPFYIWEKDFALGFILLAITRVPALKSALVFKGGTALKKIYFNNYRFSEDLDFTANDAPKGEKLTEMLTEAIRIAEVLLQQYGNFTLELKRKPEARPHPLEQEAFIIGVRFPWHSSIVCRIKIEITRNELIFTKPILKPILHDYEQAEGGELFVYSLEEIYCEKLRALLQIGIRLRTRGWSRPRSRDFYDLWQIKTNFAEQLKIALIAEALPKKCAIRDIVYADTKDFLTSEVVSEGRKHWESNLKDFVLDLPDFDLVLEEVTSGIEEICKLTKSG
ncbi:MAG: nucleotidyl transferase AbiEii/AbiGii toxin family protein [bacterium]